MAGVNGGGGELGPRSSSDVTCTASSATSSSSFLRTVSISTPGKIRQLMLARARCGSAFVAWPASSIVAIHVVRNIAFPPRILRGDELNRFRVVRIVHESVHSVGNFGVAGSGPEFRHAGEVRPVAVAELRREFIGRNTGQRGRQAIDRVVLDRPGTVAARIRHFEPVILRRLLARLHLQQDTMPLRVQFTRGALVEGKTGIDQFALVLDQPLRAVQGAARLLAAGERHLQRMTRTIFRFAEADQGVHPDRGLGLVVQRSARIEIAILLDELERVPCPVFALRLHRVEVCQQQDRLRLFVATGIDRHEAALFRMVGCGEQMQVGFGKPRRFQPAAIRSAASVQLPLESVVLVSTSSR
jgi:hypothetical protein